MDCGPAALKAVLEGFGIHTSYGRLREACQTAVDGTSIDTVEELAQKLGLEAEQIMIPADHLFFSEAHNIPAIVLTLLPNGSAHFVVLWRRHGRFLQVMDPTIGRRWMSVDNFLQEVYRHELVVPAADWRESAGGDEFLAALSRRLDDVGVSRAAAAKRIKAALGDSSWRSIAALDAAVRMVDALVQAGGLAKGGEALRMIESIGVSEIPASYWSVETVAADGSLEADPAADPERLRLKGAVLVRLLGRANAAASHPAASEELPPELAAVVGKEKSGPLRTLLELLRRDGLLSPGALICALGVSAAAVLVEALLLRALLDTGGELSVSGQRSGALAAVLVLGLAMLLLDVPVSLGLWRLGRRLEIRLRMAFFEKVPRLGDRYFASRLSSDMAERSHSIHQIRNISSLAGALLATLFELVFIAVGISWLDSRSAPFAVAAAVGAVIVPLIAHKGLAERDLRLRSHAGALSRFYLDSLVGLVPIRAHTAEETMRREHESLLSEWSRAGFRLQARMVAMLGWQLFIGFGLAIALVVSNLQRGGGESVVLLLVYWALTLPVLGQQVALLWSRYPWQRNATLRLLEPLAAAEAEGEDPSVTPAAVAGSDGPVSVSMRGVSVVAGGHELLCDVSIEIQAGSHVAVVGPSGAGKSTLVGLLLGWHRPHRGFVEVDGENLGAAQVEALRTRTAWVDPTVRLWNRTLMENVTYGNEDDNLGFAVEHAFLEEVLRTLPDGLQTCLGEGGCLLSGGEGQRVRFARGLMRRGAGLVILDEPFRGLDREMRDLLASRARALWRETTLIYVTHDVIQTLDFDQVVVVDRGRVVEQGVPRELSKIDGSRYHELLAKEREVHEKLWSNVRWRRLWMHEGRLNEQIAEDSTG